VRFVRVVKRDAVLLLDSLRTAACREAEDLRRFRSDVANAFASERVKRLDIDALPPEQLALRLLYTYDAADELSRVARGGRRIH